MDKEKINWKEIDKIDNKTDKQLDRSLDKVDKEGGRWKKP